MALNNRDSTRLATHIWNLRRATYSLRIRGDLSRTLSYAQGPSERPLLGETISANLERTTARVPGAEALVAGQQGLRYTYAEFNQAADRLASGMLAAGLERGERVGIWSPNRAEWALTQYATAKLGVILVNINPAYPREIEEFLHTHPGVADVRIIGVPDERYGEELMAWVVLRPGVALEPEELREFCRGQMAHYKIPRYIKFVPEFPMTVTGKVQKYKMRESAVQELGLGEAASIATA